MIQCPIEHNYTRDTHGALPRSAHSTLISLIPRIGFENKTYLTIQFQCEHMLTLRGQKVPKSLRLVDLVRSLWRGVSLVNEFESLVLYRNLLQTSPVFVKELTKVNTEDARITMDATLRPHSKLIVNHCWSGS